MKPCLESFSKRWLLAYCLLCTCRLVLGFDHCGTSQGASKRGCRGDLPAERQLQPRVPAYPLREDQPGTDPPPHRVLRGGFLLRLHGCGTTQAAEIQWGGGPASALCPHLPASCKCPGGSGIWPVFHSHGATKRDLPSAETHLPPVCGDPEPPAPVQGGH